MYSHSDIDANWKEKLKKIRKMRKKKEGGRKIRGKWPLNITDGNYLT
jgi:hypothetical protein